MSKIANILAFPSEDARRAHFLAILKSKLNDPEFRKTEGFPKGSDEDILPKSLHGGLHPL